MHVTNRERGVCVVGGGGGRVPVYQHQQAEPYIFAQLSHRNRHRNIILIAQSERFMRRE